MRPKHLFISILKTLLREAWRFIIVKEGTLIEQINGPMLAYGKGIWHSVASPLGLMSIRIVRMNPYLTSPQFSRQFNGVFF